MSENQPYAEPLTREEMRDLYDDGDPFWSKPLVCVVCGEDVRRVNDEGVCPRCEERIAEEG